jgi:hypothetical protein
MKPETVVLATIAANQSLSGSVDLGGSFVIGLVMPAAWTPAVATLQGSADGTTFYDLYDGMAGSELAFNVKPGTMVNINPNRLRCCAAIKLRSGTGAKPVLQTAARQFTLITSLTVSTTEE